MIVERRGLAACVCGLLLAGLVSCGGASSGSGSSAGSPLVVAPADVHVLGTSDSIAIVEDLEVLPGGRVWVLNSGAPFFVGFGPDGRVLDAYGERGGGPNEFGGPAGFVDGGIDGQAWVFDAPRHEMREVSRPDSARAVVRLPRDDIPPMSVMSGLNLLTSQVVRTARLGNELILPRRSNPPESGVFSIWLSVWTADLVALDPRTDSVRTVVPLARVLGDPTPHYDLTGAGGLPFPIWYRLWAVCGNPGNPGSAGSPGSPENREIRVYDRLRNEVRRFAADGTERAPIAVPALPQTVLTRDQLTRVWLTFALVEAAGAVPPSGRIDVSPADSARIRGTLRSRLTASPEQLSNLLPRYTDFRCDDQGNTWLRPFDADAGLFAGGSLWLRIAPDGTTDRVRLPDGFDPYRFTSGRIWGVQRDSLDVASIAWIAAPGGR